MATATIDYEEREDNFILEIQRIRENIQTKFAQLMHCLKVRERDLLKELDEVLDSYNSYKNEAAMIKERKRCVELLEHPEDNLIDFLIYEEPKQPNIVSFVCTEESFLSELNKVGGLVECVETVTDFRSKIKPLVSVCNQGKAAEQLDRPHGLAVDRNTGNIYVADCYNNCVKVFNTVGEYISHFGDSAGYGRMKWPRSLALCEDRILVTQGDILSQSTHNIFSYSLDGIFISKEGKYGKRELCFILPAGITYDEFSGYVYVCDSGNNRVQILTRELDYISQFGSESLSSPRDVKLSIDHIIVLDESDLCLRFFSYDLVHQKSVLPRIAGLQEINPFYFYIDRFDNILISDYDYNSVLIYNSQFKCIHRISVSTSPMGIAVDQHGRVMIACQARNHCLQIF